MRLLVAALASELVAFPDDLPGFDRLVTGPGKLQATYALTRALDATAYDEIVVVGTAGAIDARLDADVYEIAAALQHDVTDIDGIVGQHVSLPPLVELGAEGVTIATGDHFVDDAEAGRGDPAPRRGPGRHGDVRLHLGRPAVRGADPRAEGGVGSRAGRRDHRLARSGDGVQPPVAPTASAQITASDPAEPIPGQSARDCLRGPSARG